MCMRVCLLKSPTINELMLIWAFKSSNTFFFFYEIGYTKVWCMYL